LPQAVEATASACAHRALRFPAPHRGRSARCSGIEKKSAIPPTSEKRRTRPHMQRASRYRGIVAGITTAATFEHESRWCGMSTPSPDGLDVEAILSDLRASEINASISWSCDGRIDVKLGDPLNGYDAEGKMETFAEAAEWLRAKALMHYPRSEFSHKYAACDQARENTGTYWSEMDLIDLGNMLTRELPIKEIANRLCRSPVEVRDKIAELGRACKDDRSHHHHRKRSLELVGR